jgi:hypothetical protein
VTFLAIAFSVVCASLALYIGWLGIQQHRLAERLRIVQLKLESERPSTSRAKRSSARAA